MEARIFGTRRQNPCAVEDCFPTPVHRVPKILPERTISEKGRFVQDFRRIKDTTGDTEDFLISHECLAPSYLLTPGCKWGFRVTKNVPLLAEKRIGRGLVY